MARLTCDEIQENLAKYEAGELDEQETQELFSGLGRTHSAGHVEHFEVAPGVNIIDQKEFEERYFNSI